MKTLAFTFLLIASFLQADAQTFATAVEYNDFIVNEQNNIGKKILLFTEKFGEEGMTQAVITKALEDLLRTANASVLAVKGMTPYEDGAALKQTSLELFQFYVQIIDRDYREMVNLVFSSVLDEAAVTKLTGILEKLTADEAVYDEQFRIAQHAFAEKHDIILEENELQEEIDKQ